MSFSLFVLSASDPLSPPTPVFPDQTRIKKNECFSQVQKFLFDPPVKMHQAPQKQKSPDRETDPGISLFYPQDLRQALFREGITLSSGRSSDSLALPATFPYHRSEQWRTAAGRVPFTKRARLQRRARPRL
jgi:hypothetical protein